MDRRHDQHAESRHPFAIHPWRDGGLAKTSTNAGISIPQLMLGGAIMMEVSITHGSGLN
jgi:hypothetical protein